MGAVIAFKPRPAPVVRSGKPNPYAFLITEAMRWRADQAQQDKLDEAKRIMREAVETPAKPTAADEILKLLRRIDRRLSKLAAAEASPGCDNASVRAGNA